MTLDDVEVDSALLDIKGDIERAVRRARSLDLRRIKDPHRRTLVNDIRQQGSALLTQIKEAE